MLPTTALPTFPCRIQGSCPPSPYKHALQESGELEEVSDAHTMITNILNTSNDLCHLQALQLPLDISHDSTGMYVISRVVRNMPGKSRD